MYLPPFLQDDGDGFLHLTGHRIGLHHVIRLFKQGQLPETLAKTYPTLPQALIEQVIAFYHEHPAEVDAYIADHDREIERQRAEARPAPTIEELKQRLEDRRQGEQQASVSAEAGAD